MEQPEDASVGMLEARGIQGPGQGGPGRLDLLPATSLRVRSGQVLVAVADPGPVHMLLGLALAGRLGDMAGRVTLDGSEDRAQLQRSVLLVDAPGVNEPDAGVPVHTVVGEELAMAGEPTGRAAVRRRVEPWGIDPDAAIDHLAASQRIGLMVSLAMLRRPRFLVVPLPGRHGGLPQDWFGSIDACAADGVGVVVTASRGLADRYPVPEVVEIGNAVDDREDRQEEAS